MHHSNIKKQLSFFLALFVLNITSSHAQSIKVLHYNIKELDTIKIQNNEPQLGFVKKILNKKSIDFLSVNEVQYDMKNVPSVIYDTTGENLQRLLKYLNLHHLKYQSFNPANTGENAKRKKDGTYYISPSTPEARAHADQLNFGVMPGQYSTGALSKYEIINEKIIKNLYWKDFNPSIDFSKFKTAEGKPIPQDMKLFDKNFSDITINVGGKILHIILLHTVPSYHFGNPNSINMVRNADQLRFLEWYITASTDIKVPLKNIKPFNKMTSYIAMGDFNVDVKSTTSPGAKVLQRLFKKSSPWIPIDKMTFTNEGGGFSPDKNKLLLDYIITSKNIRTVHGEIMHPDFKRIELGCQGNEKNEVKLNKKVQSKYIKVDYIKDNKTCYAYVLKDYFYYKKASDHYPTYGEFEFK